jgi:hypothetical protein
MTELSNAVTVLIARMETHPEDFQFTGLSRPKFADLAEYLTMLASGATKNQKDYEPHIRQAYWFLTDADKKALLDAFKKMYYNDFEKGVMKRVFDEEYYERQEEQQRQLRMYAQQAQSSYPYVSNSAQNAAQNTSGHTGLLGQAGSAFQGLFK